MPISRHTCIFSPITLHLTNVTVSFVNLPEPWFLVNDSYLENHLNASFLLGSGSNILSHSFINSFHSTTLSHSGLCILFFLMDGKIYTFLFLLLCYGAGGLIVHTERSFHVIFTKTYKVYFQGNVILLFLYTFSLYFLCHLKASHHMQAPNIWNTLFGSKLVRS